MTKNPNFFFVTSNDNKNGDETLDKKFQTHENGDETFFFKFYFHDS